MGFLLGAFGKLAASQRKRSIQAQMMRIQSKLRIATRQISNYSKMIENNKKSELNGINAWFAGLKSTLGPQVQARMAANGQTFDPTNAQLMGLYTQELSAATAQLEAQKSYQEQQIVNKYEYMNDMLLEPMKMEEEALQLENDSLKSQLAIAEEDYKACEQMEQAGAKDLAPKYVAGGGG